MSSDSKPIRFECQLCGACCREEGFLITLTSNDVVRLSFALGLGVQELLRAIDFHVLGQGTGPPPGLRDFPLIQTEAGPAYMALRKSENGDCIFLENNKCMIHPVRPGVCQAFPFVFRKDSGELYWGLSAKKDICPGIGEGAPLQAADLESLARSILGEQSAFRQFVTDWNETETSPTAASFIHAILESQRLDA